MSDMLLECGAPAPLWYRDGVRASLSCAANHTKAVQGHRTSRTYRTYDHKVPSLCVLNCLHQSRQCVFGVAVEHAGHRLEKEGIFEAGETFTLSSF